MAKKQDGTAPLDVLAIAPHPDDAELGVGGILALATSKGRRAGILDLTAGEMSSKGDPDTRKSEARAAGKVLGLAFRGNLGLTDGDLRDSAEARIALAALLRRLRPTTVLAPHPVDRHPDHIGAAYLSRAAVHLSGLRRAPVDGVPHRVTKLYTYPGNDLVPPTLYVDISATIETWERAVAAFASQFEGEAISEAVSPEGVVARRARRRVWGNQVGVAYAEALISDRPLLVELW